MNLVSQLQCKKDFATFCKQHRIPVHRSPVYWGRVYAFYSSRWAKQRNLQPTKQ